MKEDNNKQNKKVNLIDIEKVIRNQPNRLVRNLPGFLINLIKKIVKQKEINGVISRHKDKHGVDFMKAGMDDYNMKYTAYGIENIPDKGRFIFVSNHPLGGADYGAIVIAASKKHPNIKVLANDVLTNLENLKELFLPVGVFGKTSLKARKNIEIVMASGDVQILSFPAGLVSRKHKGEVCDLEWNRSFVHFAKLHNRHVIPVFVDAKNSRLFYFISNFRTFIGLKKVNLELFLIPSEFFKKKNKEIPVYFGKPIAPEEFTEDKTEKEWAEIIRNKTYRLKEEYHQKTENPK